MDFAAWSPSHLIVAAITIVTIIGQAIIVLTRLKATTEPLDKQAEIRYTALAKRFDDVNKRM